MLARYYQPGSPAYVSQEHLCRPRPFHSKTLLIFQVSRVHYFLVFFIGGDVQHHGQDGQDGDGDQDDDHPLAGGDQPILAALLEEVDPGYGQDDKCPPTCVADLLCVLCPCSNCVPPSVCPRCRPSYTPSVCWPSVWVICSYKCFIHHH